MRNITGIRGWKHARHGWAENVVTIILAALIVIPFFAEWLNWAYMPFGR
jgi:hypothetical protein